MPNSNVHSQDDFKDNQVLETYLDLISDDFQQAIRTWYLANARDLPWRVPPSVKETNQTTNLTPYPYHVWLSEIMLQQTTVATVKSYFNKFLDKWPDLQTFSKADEDQVLTAWQGLGYYSRARNLHFSAKYIVKELNGAFPENYEGLIKLKGVGDYTASAIASICFDEPTAVVDGNVYRLLSRYFGLKSPINSSRGIKEFK